MSEFLRHLAIWLPALLVSFTVHEYAHAWTATRLGDSTPVRQGRLTFSPVAHLDPIGSFIVPVVLLVFSNGASTFGWAKPVEFVPTNFDRRVTMRRGAALTAAAGPLSNVFLALLSLLAIELLVRFGVIGMFDPTTQSRMLREFLVAMFRLNILLAVFNALPIPPLDGSYFLPRSMDDLKDNLAVLGPFLIIALFVFGPGHYILRPLEMALSSMLHAVVGLFF